MYRNREPKILSRKIELHSQTVAYLFLQYLHERDQNENENAFAPCKNADPKRFRSSENSSLRLAYSYVPADQSISISFTVHTYVRY